MNTGIQTNVVAMMVLATSFSCSGMKKEVKKEVLPNIVLLMGDDHVFPTITSLICRYIKFTFYSTN